MGRWLFDQFRATMREPLQSRSFTTLLFLLPLCGLLTRAPLAPYAESLLLHRLPVSEPDRLVTITQTYGDRGPIPITPYTLWRWQQESTTLEALAGYTYKPLSQDGHQVVAAMVAPDFFPLLGIRPVLGRLFAASDGRPGAVPAVVVSHDYWQRQMKADPHAVGKLVVLSSVPHRVVGVLPASFWFLLRHAEVWVSRPITADPRATRDRFSGAIARLRPGSNVDEAQSDLSFASAWLRAETPWRFARLGASVSPLSQGLLTDIRPALFMWLGPWLIVCWYAGAHIRRVRAKASSRSLARYTGLLCAKLLLTGTLLLALWTIALDQIFPAILWSEYLALPLQAALYMGYFLLSGLLALLCWRDLHYRCPVCLSRLRMPLANGSYGSTLLAPPSREWICVEGHGQLVVPDPLPAGEDASEWKKARNMWEELAGSNP